MSRRVLAIDIGGSKLLVGIVEPDGRIVSTRRLSLAKETTGSEIVDHVVRLYEQLVSEAEGPAAVGAGITIPGLTDPAAGLWVYAPFSGIRNFAICERVSSRVGLRACCENDVNASAVAEKRYGICRGVDNYLWVTVSNGVGGGVFINGRLYRGAFGYSGEIGHIVIEGAGGDREGSDVESLIGGPALVERYRRMCRGAGADDTITPRSIADRARRGEAAARAIYRSVGQYLGVAIAAAVNVLNPEMVVVGGGISCAFDLFQDALLSTVRERVFGPANSGLSIRKSRFPVEAALLGAAAIAFETAGGER